LIISFFLSFSILFGEQNTGRRAVGFGDHRELVARAGAVGAQEPEAVTKRKLVFLPVFRGNFSPVTTDMASKKISRLLTCLSKRGQRTGGNPEIKVLATPTYVNTPERLVISVVTSQVNQPPSAPPAETTTRIQYAKVGAFQLPSNVILDTSNVGVFEVGFNSCQVSVSEGASKPTAEKSGQIN
jgi:hypothetical protein